MFTQERLAVIHGNVVCSFMVMKFLRSMDDLCCYIVREINECSYNDEERDYQLILRTLSH